MTDDQQRARELRDLIDKYWCLAYAEGKENRTHDTEEGDAQRVSIAIDKAITALRAAPEGFVLVPVAEVESALDVVRDAMECAYHNRFPECCGQYSPIGCCGNPREAWSKEDQSIMDALHPAEQALSAMLAARPQGVK